MKSSIAILLACASAGVIPFSAALASDPASHDVVLPITSGETVVVEWTGTALPGGSGQGTTGGVADRAQPCPPTGPDDAHTINLTVPEGAYEAINVTADFHIQWQEGAPDPSGNFTDPDLVLTVYKGLESQGYSDGGSPEENVGLSNPTAGAYSAVVCPFVASQPTPYTAKLTLTATAIPECVTAPTTKALSHSTLVSTAAVVDPESPKRPNIDTYLQETAHGAAAVPEGFGRRWQAPLFDRATGKTTFLWARKDAPVASVGALNAKDLLIERARAHLREESKNLRLTRAMIDGAEAFDAQFNGNGPAVVRFRQRVAGHEVYKRSLSVLLSKQYQPIAVSGTFATDDAATPASFARTAPQAIAAAWTNLGGALDASALSRTVVKGEYELYSTPALSGSHAFERAPRVKQVYYARPGRLEPAYYVELFARARSNGQLIAYAFVVSALDATILHRENLIANAYSYRMYAETAAPFTPFDSPLGNGYTPFPGTDPDEIIARVGATPNLLTLDHAGIVTGDPWLPEGATDLIGNHVDSCIDSFDNAADGLTDTPLNTCDPILGDYRAPPSGPSTWDYTQLADSDPSTQEARAAAQVNLFFMNNWLHDQWYNHGFDEASGNAQMSNYERGGAEGDPIIAQGQDGSGRNNANMGTPSDGSSPTMQQDPFDGPAVGDVRVLTPVDSGPLVWVPIHDVGPATFDVTGEVMLADDGSGDSPTDGCGPSTPASDLTLAPAPPQPALAGKIALIDRGNCTFTSKEFFAQASGAIGIVLVNNADGNPPSNIGNADVPVVPVAPTAPAYVTPIVLIRKDAGNVIKEQVAAGTVTMQLVREPTQDIDGTLDNQIIAHEYFHYVHHRLTASSNQQSGAMSEGWGDIDAFVLGARADDLTAPDNDHWQGAYDEAGYVTNNFFSGIRRAPYSTDPAKNVYTFKHLSDGEPTPDGGPGDSNSEVHSAGEIWANMMWNCYAGLLNDPRHSFAEAKSRMQDYIIGGLKMTPADATYTEARDAVIAVALANDFQDYAECSHGFATHGAGLHAVAPGRSSTTLTGVVEDYTDFACPLSLDPGTPSVPDPTTVVADTTRFGGAMPLALLAMLLGGSLLRRRRH